MTNTLPVHPRLLHPLTGKPLRAVGTRRNGDPIWPIMGSDGTDDPPAEPPPSDPPPADPPPPGDDWVKAFDGMTPDQVKDALENSRKWEGRAKGNKDKADQLDALAKLITGADTPPDPQQLASDLGAAQREARETRIELAALKAAPRHGADPALLSDSRSFMAAAAALDPAAADFAASLDAAIKKAVEENPALKAGASPVQPNRQQGNPSEGKQGGVQAGAEMYAASRKTASAPPTPALP